MLNASRRTGPVCLECRLRITGGRRGGVQNLRKNGPLLGRVVMSRRALHTSQKDLQTDSAVIRTPSGAPPSIHIDPSLPAKARLAKWEEIFGVPNPTELSAFENHPANKSSDVSNTSTAGLPHASQRSDQLAYDREQTEEDMEDIMDLTDGTRTDDLMTIGLFLRPGDVVELGRPGSGQESMTAVFVRQLGFTSQYLTLAGRWSTGAVSTVSFVLPGVVDPKLLRPIVPYLPTTEDLAAVELSGAMQIPRELSAPVTDILQSLKDESERIYRENATVLDSAYATLADQSRIRIMTTAQIAKALLSRNDPQWSSSPAKLLAVRKAIVRDEYRFVSDIRSARVTNVFSIRPKDDVEAMGVVHEWIREYSELIALNTTNSTAASPPKGAKHVMDFVEKARRLILQSRQWRDPLLGNVGPRKSHPPAPVGNVSWGEEFTSTDKRIINFMHAWAVTNQFKLQGPFHTAGAKILEFTGLYEGLPHKNHLTRGEKNTESGFLFMQEIGVISPHENRTLYDEHLMLPTVRLSRNLELLNTKAELIRRNPDFKDSMAALRHDWGNTNVYCIDDAGAREIDDGLSTSPVDGTDSQRWVHIHVANPTAFFEKTHVLSGLAAHMTETVYAVEGAFPMLPSWVSQNYFSLAPNRPVLTISARVDLTSGEVVERKITPGIVRNVVSMTYSELAECLGDSGQTSSWTSLVIGEKFPNRPTRTPRNLSAAQRQELQQLYEVAIARGNRRHSRGAYSYTMRWLADVRTFLPGSGEALSWYPPSLDRARFIHNDPTIEISATKVLDKMTDEVTPAKLVEEMMILASAVAGDWCAERNIPALYKGTINTPAKASMMPLQKFREEQLIPRMRRDGFVSREIAIQYLNSLPSSITHYSPLKHEVLALDAFVKVTSPLRRFADMINHWQIEAALRRESQTGRMFNSDDITTNGPRILPFSQRHIRESIITLTPREKLIKRTSHLSNHFWIVMALARAHYYGEGNFPQTVTVSILTASGLKGTSIGLVTNYGFTVDIISTEPDMFRIGDEWECSVATVNVFKRKIYFKPISLVRRATSHD